MRKTFTLFLAISFFSFNLFAGGDWASSAISIAKDGTAYSYILNNAGWTDGTWGSNIAFDNYNFGTPTSLTINGASGNGWTDDVPGYTTTSFIIYYRVYKVSDTPGTWSQIALDNQAYRNGNNCIFDKTNAAINVLALATTAGTNTYTLEVVMTKNQYYSSGSWNCMVPGGQAVGYSSSTAGYKASFTKSITALSNQYSTSASIISTQQSKINAKFEGSAQIELFTMTGQRITKTNAANQYSQTVKSGAYILYINGETHKVLVP